MTCFTRFFSALFSFLLALLFVSVTAFAAGGRGDYDVDNNGLIEIFDLADLNAMRVDLTGATLYSQNVGCPAEGCKGFELHRDLDFDTNGDQILDNRDTYWNGGKGWIPIGASSPFSATFDGNGHVIRNLMINRPLYNRLGLFGRTRDAIIRNVRIEGPLVEIHGKNDVGGLIGYAERTEIIASAFSGRVKASGNWNTNVGGLVGVTVDSRLFGSFAAAFVVAKADQAGGLVGNARRSTIEASFSSGRVQGAAVVGGLLGAVDTSVVSASYTLSKVVAMEAAGGLSGDRVDVNRSYWAIDTTGQTESPGEGLGTTLDNMRCPISEGDSACPLRLYVDWDKQKNVEGENIWEFGHANQIPGLNINNHIFRDSDGDGVLDEHDQFPTHNAASIDADGDGAPDRWNSFCDKNCRDSSGLVYDHFPENFAVYNDLDFDGLADNWNPDCDQDCRDASGIILDEKPGNRDNDDENDDVDTDDNNDGIKDADADSDGLIDINSLADLFAIRHELAGHGRKHDDGLDSSGCPAAVENGVMQQVCVGYELLVDLDFDTNSNGMFDENDAYWNGGAGWQPIADSALENGDAFTGIFDGNGHTIRNLVINNPDAHFAGLFGHTSGAEIRDVVLIGRHMQINAKMMVGSLVGSARNTEIRGIFLAGEVIANERIAGGMLGSSKGSRISASYVATRVSGGPVTGGFIGQASNTHVAASLFGGQINSPRGGGIVGLDREHNDIINSYWSIETAGGFDRVTRFGTTASLQLLKCPTTADNTQCAIASEDALYKEWASQQDHRGTVYWNFGSATQLPGLNLETKVFRDSDGDGVLDSDDAFPENIEAAYDKDGDGFPDMWSLVCGGTCREASELVIDQFPDNPAAAVDADLDGRPDTWNTGCDDPCKDESGLESDPFLGDSDNDGDNDLTKDDDDNGDGIIDADADSDGLIDVANWSELNAIRYSLNGHYQRMSADGEADSSGCPKRIENGVLQSVCFGYELVDDLDFEQVKHDELYWHEGAGWKPLGESIKTPFSAIFDGNGHVIKNLFIKRELIDQSLFGVIEQGEVRNLGLIGKAMSISGTHYVGSLASKVYYSTIESSYATGRVSASGIQVGGLVGFAHGSQIKGCFSTGDVSAGGYAGGLVGSANGTTLTATYATGSVSAPAYLGGLVGSIFNTQVVASYATGHLENNGNVVFGQPGGLIGFGGVATASYWAIDTSGTSFGGGGIGYELAQLQCPTGANNASCASGLLYVGWADIRDRQDRPYWDFGTARQMPGLNINGKTLHDSDGDGVLDEHDAFPEVYAAARDDDGDNAPDQWTRPCDYSCRENSGLVLDQFPGHIEAAVDADLDGFPDDWSDACKADPDCGADSSLTLDDYPGDRDNDGDSDLLDSDDNGDGIPDADADSDGLIDIASLKELDAVRYKLDGSGQKTTQDADIDTSGCPVVVSGGVYVVKCSGYELTSDLNFDQNGDGNVNLADGSDYWNILGWSPIGDEDASFSAIFEGNGFYIRNINMQAYKDYRGVFGHISDAHIRNLGVMAGKKPIKGRDYIGGITGFAKDSTIEKSVFQGNLDGVDQVGGIAGAAENSVIKESVAHGKVDASGTSVGGLVGEIRHSDVSASLSQGAVTAQGNSAGGLVGQSEQSTIKTSFSTGPVEGYRYVGGLVGYHRSSQLIASYAYGRVDGEFEFGGLIGSFTPASDAVEPIKASYWVVGLNNNADGSANGLGLTLAELQCPTTADDSDCAGTPILAGWADYLDDNEQAYWRYGTERQLPSLNLVGPAYRDSDGDGVSDPKDSFPFQREAFEDRDADGAPDSWADACDLACQQQSTLILDGFPNSAAAFLDADNDGLVDAWTPDCLYTCQINSGLTRDTHLDDSDNDGVKNDHDALPLNPNESRDFDGDGEGDNADTDDDNDNVPDWLDAFPRNSAESVDTDGDRIGNNADLDDDGDNVPDTEDAFPLDFQEHKDSDGDGEGDFADHDDDNDGVFDWDDPNMGLDDGKPSLITVPETQHIMATGEFTPVVLAFDQLTATDKVDTELEFVVFFDGNELTPSENDEVLLPSGANALKWRAVDDRGNLSPAVTQIINIYPQLGFADLNSTTGEATVFPIALQLSGPSPVYPIDILVSWKVAQSTATADDLDLAIDGGWQQGALLVTVNNVTELANVLTVPIRDDDTVENDEEIILEITSAQVSDQQTLPLYPGRLQHSLKITDFNLAPEVSLRVLQQGEEVATVDSAKGEVTLSAMVTDLNGKDTHSYQWNVTSLAIPPENTAELTFNPENLEQGPYWVAVSVTDNGNPPLSSTEVSTGFEIFIEGEHPGDIPKPGGELPGDQDRETGTDAGSNEPDDTDGNKEPSDNGGETSTGGDTVTENEKASSSGGGGNLDYLLAMFLLSAFLYRYTNLTKRLP